MLIAERRVSTILPNVAPPGVRLRFTEDAWIITGIRQVDVAGRPLLVIDTALAWDEERKAVDITAAIQDALKAMDKAADRLRATPVACARLELVELVIARDRLRAALAPPETCAGQWYHVTEREEARRRQLEKQKRQAYIDGLRDNIERARDRIQQLLGAGDRLDKAIGGNADEILAAVQNWRAITTPQKKQQTRKSKPQQPRQRTSS
jgi:hypothetical protein